MSDQMNFLLDIGKMLLMNVPFILLCLRARKVNLDASERSKQFGAPVFAVLYALAAGLLTNRLNTFLVEKIRAVSDWLSTLTGVNGLPDQINTVIRQLSQRAALFIKGLNLTFWVFFISNLLIMAAYLLLKRIMLEVMKKAVKNNGELHKSVASHFYDYHEDKDVWCIKDRFVQARTLLNAFYITTIILTVLLMMISCKLYQNEYLRAVFYPVFSVIFVGEVYFFLKGVSWTEYLQTFIGEEEDTFKTVNYSLLRKALRTLFGDKLLAENTVVNNALTYSTTNDEIVERLETDEDPMITAFAGYLRHRLRDGFTLDHNYVHSAVDLLKGKSVLFNNPFYNDLIPYAFYPMNRALLKQNKVLVLLGRHAIESEITDWIGRGIGAVTHIPYLWKIETLTDTATDADIGIITRSDMLNGAVISANARFLSQVSYCVIIEPSRLLPTSQIGMELIIRRCREHGNEEITFCMCDKNADGLIDALSHVLMTNLTEVFATNKHLGTSSYMCWDTDDEHLHHRLFPNVSRYLGTGTELSFAALKNQVSVTKWFGGDVFPVSDINWIDRQYYYDLTKYAGIPGNQESFNERFRTYANPWSATISETNYFTVEDEPNNMFEILRVFATRSKEQGFINVISSDYLLRDYMAVNAPIFETDPKAIPCLSADHARTRRNMVLRMLLRLKSGPVRRDAVENEFSILGVRTFNVKKQFWFELYQHFADAQSIHALPAAYEEAVDAAFRLRFTFNDREIESGILTLSEEYNVFSGHIESHLACTDEAFLRSVVADLRSAGYLAEDEKGDRHYIGAELRSHVYQKLLPGQFFTFGGKHYEMLYLTSDGNVLIRRAADHITDRHTYRQIRRYTLREGEVGSLGSVINVDGLRVTKLFAGFDVETLGYYKLEKYSDFVRAQKILYEDGNVIPVRSCRNKQILKLDFPSLGGKFTDDVRYTLTVLLNEVFRTLFAENQQFIIATTDTSFMDADETDAAGDAAADEFETAFESQPDTQEAATVADGEADAEEQTPAETPADPGVQTQTEAAPETQADTEIVAESAPMVMASNDVCVIPDAETDTLPESGADVQADDWTDDENSRQPEQQEARPTHTQPLTYSVTGDAVDAGSIYIIEDSDLDLGLLITVERNLQRIFKIIDDYLDWHFEAVALSKNPPPEPAIYTPKEPEEEEKQEEEKELTWFQRLLRPFKKIINKIRGLFRPKKQPEPEAEQTPTGDFETSFGGEPEVVPFDPAENPAPVGDDSVPQYAPQPFHVPQAQAVPQSPTPEQADAIDPSYGGATVQIPFDTSDVPADASDAGRTIELPQTQQDADVPAQQEDDDAQATVLFNKSFRLRDDDAPALEKKRKPYHENNFLFFGGTEIPAHIVPRETLAVLNAMGFDRNELKQAREARKKGIAEDENYAPNKPGAKYCDFCGTEIYGVEYETLSDGRDRCINCSNTSVKTPEEFKKIFDDVKRNMESFYGIKIHAGIRVEMVNAKKLHRKLNDSFVPTDNYDPRTVGVAIKDRSGYTICVENGAPKIKTMLTIAHELTHIWQYLNWDEKALRNLYGRDSMLEVYEGMAKWVEIQYAYLINEPITAKREEILTLHRNDEYGRGFVRYRTNYPFSVGTAITKPTPFMNVGDPLTPKL